MRAASSTPNWLSLAPYLDRALDLEPVEREAWIAELTTAEPQLAGILRGLLDRHARLDSERFLATESLNVAAGKSYAGRRIGAYTVESLLGRGGMGEVWLATRSDGRYEGQCAIKFLDASVASSKLVERFRREGNFLARLTHPSIARLLDAGTTDDGQPYLALEFVDGERIDHYCKGHALSTDARVRLFVDVVAAVAHAHSQLIIHRDLKPSNVLVTRKGAIKLLDFGVAKLLGSEHGADEMELTRIEDAALTPEYAAPEQLFGDMPSTATDVYQLGMLLFVLLTEKHPLATAGTRAEKIRGALDGVIPRASEAANEIDRKKLRGDLDAILAMALRKIPSERYATAQAFNDELQRYLHREPVLARRGALWYRARKFVARHRIGVAAATLTLVTLIAGIATTSWQAIEARRARSLAEESANEARLQRDKERFEARVATANQEFMSQIFGDAMRGGESEHMRQRLDEGRELLRLRYRNDPEVHAMLLMQLAGRYAEMRAADREADVMRELRELADGGTDFTLKAQMECIDAYDLIRANHSEEAAPHIELGLELTKRARRPVEAAFECWRAEAMLAVDRGNSSYAVARMKELLAWIEREGRKDTRLYLSAVGSLAYIHQRAKNFAAALLVTREKISLDTRLGSNQTLSSYVDVEREAGLLFELGRMLESATLDIDLEAGMRSANDRGEIPATFMIGMARRAIANGDQKRAIELLNAVRKEYAHTHQDSNLRGALLDLADANLLSGDRQAATAALNQFATNLSSAMPGRREAIESCRVRLLLAVSAHLPRAKIHERRRELIAALEAAPNMNRVVALKGRLAAASAALHVADLVDARTQAERALLLAETAVLSEQTSAWIGASQLLLARTELAAKHFPAAQEHARIAKEHLSGSLSRTHWLCTEAALVTREVDSAISKLAIENTPNVQRIPNVRAIGGRTQG